MASYQTPGVYVEEVSTLPPSVAEVSTAIPAFFGYTERGAGVARVSTMLEFTERFGGPQRSKYTVTTRPQRPGDPSGPRVVDAITREPDAPASYLLHGALSLYFKNGGGPCYVASVGNYGQAPAAADFEAGLAAIEREDEPTLLVLTDAVTLDAASYYAVCQQALAQCQRLGDRFTILDVKDGDVDGLRGSAGVGADHLMYGAAYHPYLMTALARRIADEDVAITGAAPKDTSRSWSLAFGGLVVGFSGVDGVAPRAQLLTGDGALEVDASGCVADPLPVALTVDRTTRVLVATCR
ncbi:MAG: hypothetical protein KC636_29965 [Myxococcales bacterium]|nr:hypothetical protein [Myxococcales bacterium]